MKDFTMIKPNTDHDICVICGKTRGNHYGHDSRCSKFYEGNFEGQEKKEKKTIHDLPKNHDCPKCEGHATLRKDKLSIFYQCCKCDLQFTTDESDTISMLDYKPKVEVSNLDYNDSFKGVYEIRIQKLLSKFANGKQLYNESVIFHSAIESLAREEKPDPWRIITDLLMIIEKQHDATYEHLKKCKGENNNAWGTII